MQAKNYFTLIFYTRLVKRILKANTIQEPIRDENCLQQVSQPC